MEILPNWSFCCEAQLAAAIGLTVPYLILPIFVDCFECIASYLVNDDAIFVYKCLWFAGKLIFFLWTRIVSVSDWPHSTSFDCINFCRLFRIYFCRISVMTTRILAIKCSNVFGLLANWSFCCWLQLLRLGMEYYFINMTAAIGLSRLFRTIFFPIWAMATWTLAIKCPKSITLFFNDVPQKIVQRCQITVSWRLIDITI